MSNNRGQLTAEQLALCAAMEHQHGIPRRTTRRRILAGWPVGRLHEQPVTDPVRNARTSRPPRHRKPSASPWALWTGPEHLNRRTNPTNPET